MPYERVGMPYERVGMPCEEAGMPYEEVGTPYEQVGMPCEEAEHLCLFGASPYERVERLSIEEGRPSVLAKAHEKQPARRSK
jgi:hypothetical protein